MPETVQESIQVVVSFKNGQCQPLAFAWQGRRYVIQRIYLAHTVRQGREMLYHFSAGDGANLFHLVFDTGRMHWELAEVGDLPQ